MDLESDIARSNVTDGSSYGGDSKILPQSEPAIGADAHKGPQLEVVGLAGVDSEAHTQHESHAYIESLRNIKRTLYTNVTLPYLKQGLISHMRLSHSGHWLVVCHHDACIVYDVKVPSIYCSARYNNVLLIILRAPVNLRISCWAQMTMWSRMRLSMLNGPHRQHPSLSECPIAHSCLFAHSRRWPSGRSQNHNLAM